MPVRATDTKKRILETATNLFSCRGYHTTSIDDILTAVGITKGAFYHHFKGKNHLCEEILDEAIARYQELTQTLQTREHQGNLLRQWCSTLIGEQTSGQWLYYRLLTRLTIESPELPPHMQNQLRLFWSWCQNFYETLLRDTTPEKNTAPEHLAKLFLSMHFGTIWLNHCCEPSHEPTTSCETLLKLIES